MNNKQRSASVTTDLIEICQLLVGLKDVRILEYRRYGLIPMLKVESIVDGQPRCLRCQQRAYVKERPEATYVDLACFGTAMRLVWRKHRFGCVNERCPVKTWTHSDPRIAAKGSMLTNRAARYAVQQVGIHGRTVSDVAKEMCCGWDAVNGAVITYGEVLLAADRKRLKDTSALGLDETNFKRTGKYKHAEYVTTVADVQNGLLIDILPTRKYEKVAEWINDQTETWKARIKYGALDMSNTYAAVYSVMLPDAAQVVDSFHCIQLANRTLDAIRRRVQNETTGHRGRKGDPLFKARRVLLMGEDKLNEKAAARIQSLLELGDPGGEVAIAYRVKERLRDFYATTDAGLARQMLNELVEHCTKVAMPPEIRQLGRTLKRWFDKICNYHLAKVSNGPTEALNNLIKRIKRIGFGFRNFRNYRIRALLYAGKPNWRVLGSIVVE